MQIFKRQVFGIDFDIEIDFWGPIFKTIQRVYEFKLWRMWQKDTRIKSRLSNEFIKYALKNLPVGSFVVFDFVPDSDKFVQFANIDGVVTLDVPVWVTNEYCNRKLDIKRILSKSGIKRASIYRVHNYKKNYEIRVSFGKHYSKATEVALLICKEIFDVQNPCVFEYKTDNLVVR